MGKLLRLFIISTLSFSCAIGSEAPSPSNTSEPSKVYIYSVKATPTDQESITIKNNSGTTQDLSHWTLGDKNDPNAYNIPNGTSLIDGEMKTFKHTTIGFAINDHGETIYLKDSSGSTVDTWTN